MIVESWLWMQSESQESVIWQKRDSSRANGERDIAQPLNLFTAVSQAFLHTDVKCIEPSWLIKLTYKCANEHYLLVLISRLNFVRIFWFIKRKYILSFTDTCVKIIIAKILLQNYQNYFWSRFPSNHAITTIKNQVYFFRPSYCWWKGETGQAHKPSTALINSIT